MVNRTIVMRDILSRQDILLDLGAMTKKEVLQSIAAHAAASINRDAHIIFDVLWEREKLGTTGVGYGIAIPHGRVEKLDKVKGFFVRLAQPVPFESIDDKPVDLVFLLLAPESAGADHLHVLATVSRLLRNTGLCENLRRAKDAAAIYQLLTEAEAAEVAA
jgi:PTS system nitrogen regulatory IIA component